MPKAPKATLHLLALILSATGSLRAEELSTDFPKPAIPRELAPRMGLPFGDNSQAEADYPALRFLETEWAESTPKTVGACYSNSFVVGRKLQSELLVPIGLMNAAVAVRDAYTQHPMGANLYNTDGLPASPFSTSGY